MSQDGPLAGSLIGRGQQLDSQSVLDQANPEIAACRNHVIVEVVVTRVQRLGSSARLECAQCKETPGFFLEKVREVLARCDRQLILAKVLGPKPLLRESNHVVGLALVVNNWRV